MPHGSGLPIRFHAVSSVLWYIWVSLTYSSMGNALSYNALSYNVLLIIQVKASQLLSSSLEGTHMLLCPWKKYTPGKVTCKWEYISNDTFIFNSVSKNYGIIHNFSRDYIKE